MISSFPFNLSDVYKEVYWVDQYVTDDILPPEINGTTFEAVDQSLNISQMVDVYGHVGPQQFYSNKGTTLNKLVADSTIGGTSGPQNIFLGYEHRIPVLIRKAIFGYTTWNEIKALVTDSEVNKNILLAYRNRPTACAGTITYGNAYLESSKYFTTVRGLETLTAIKWAFLGQLDRSNIPCGRGLFIYRTITNGIIAEAVNQYAGKISAVFTEYNFSLNESYTENEVTLYYHPNDNLWKRANDTIATGYFHNEDLLSGSFGTELKDKFVFQILNGNLTKNKKYIPVTVNIKVLMVPALPDPGEEQAGAVWVDATKNISYQEDITFKGSKYEIEGVPLDGIYLEAHLVNKSYRHETSLPYTQWGVNYQFWKFIGGSKDTVETVELIIPFTN